MIPGYINNNTTNEKADINKISVLIEWLQGESYILTFQIFECICDYFIDRGQWRKFSLSNLGNPSPEVTISTLSNIVLVLSPLSKKFLNVSFIRERQRDWEHEQGKGERQRERQTDSLMTLELDEGLNLRTLRSWPAMKSDT